MNSCESTTGICIRHPGGEDAAAIWRMVEDSRTLDHNSFYCYFVLCHYFSSTCAVAEVQGRAAGFVTGFCPPERPDTLFVWQVRVLEEARGQGLAGAMVTFVLDGLKDRQIRYIEATISPDNRTSQALFRSLAKVYQTQLTETKDFLPTSLFPTEAGQHAQENLFRVGPLSGDCTVAKFRL